MKMFKNSWFWFCVFLVILFFTTYALVSIGVNKLMGDKVYGEELTVSARVEGLEVKQLPYTEQLQPAYNITKL